MKNSLQGDYKLEDSIGNLINHAAWVVRSTFEAGLAQYNITAPQWVVLCRLWEENGQAPSEICRRSFLDRPTMTGIIDRLVTKGIVTRQRSDQDRRVVRIYLTKKGSALKQKLPSVAEDADKKTLSGLSTADIKTLKNCLNTILKNLSE